jgi:hypothetical protein
LWRGRKGIRGQWVLLTGSMVGATVDSTAGVSAAANDSTEGELTGGSPAGNNGGDSAAGNSVLVASGALSGFGAASITDPRDWSFTNR